MESLWSIVGSSDDVERMMIAIANNRLDGVREQIGKGVTGDTVGETVARGPGSISMFNFACERGNLEAAQLLYAHGADIEGRGGARCTPLMSACNSLSAAIPSLPEDAPLDPDEIVRREALVRWLVERGADPNAMEPPANSVLHCAAGGCSEALVSFLVEHGARVDWPAEDKHPAFMNAARRGNLGAVRALARHGADVNRRCGIPWAKGLTTLGMLLLEQKQGYGKPGMIAELRKLGASE